MITQPDFPVTQSAQQRHYSRLDRWLFTPIDNSALIVFRIFFGMLLFFESAGAIATGWVNEVFVDPTFHFQFIGFEWLRPLPGYGMYGYYAVMALFGLMVAAGAYYRFSIVAFTLMWWAVYLMQKVHYNNHYYLLILLGFLMASVPAHRYASWDVKRNPNVRRLTCPRWCYGLFILQMGIVFTYASLNKLYPDWLQGVPIRLWLSRKTDYPVIGGLLQQDWMPWVIAYGGIVFDLLIVPALLWKRTRVPALLMALLFHLFNSAVFQIGVFPYLMLAMSVFFFPTETIRRVFLKRKPVIADESAIQPRDLRYKPVLYSIAGMYFLLQTLLPMRHVLFPGNVNWTEEGHRMAWRMMLRTKSGTIHFRLYDPVTGKKRTVYPTQYLTSDQAHTMATHPDMVWQFVQFLKREYLGSGIYAVSRVSLNGHPYASLIDPDVNLADVPWEPFRSAEWIMAADALAR